MKIKLIAIFIIASVMFGQSPAMPPPVQAKDIKAKAKIDAKDATIKALEAALKQDQEAIQAWKNRDNRTTAILQMYERGMDGDALAKAQLAAAAALAQACKDTGEKLATDALTCPPAK